MGEPAGHADYVVKLVPDQHPNWQQAVASLRREAQVARRLRHPHVVSVLSTHLHEFPYYTVTPYLRGLTLRVLLQRRRFTRSLSLSVARQTAEALVSLHQAGWLHADVKPENILVSPRGHVTLIDLGLARKLGSSECGEAAPLVGTPVYMAPEMLDRRDALTAACDLFSLGRVLDEMLRGRPASSSQASSSQASSSQASSSQASSSQASSSQDATTGVVEVDGAFEMAGTVEAAGAPGDGSDTFPRPISQLVDLLLDRRPRCRPSAQELVRCLSHLEQSLADPRAAA